MFRPRLLGLKVKEQAFTTPQFGLFDGVVKLELLDS